MTKLPKFQASFNRIYGKYKARAARDSRVFDLTREEFRELCEQDCRFCGAFPTASQSKTHAQLNGVWKHSGLDRIDSSGGYTLGNVQPCCWLCNQLKSNIDEEVFLNHIKKIVFLSHWLRPFMDE